MLFGQKAYSVLRDMRRKEFTLALAVIMIVSSGVGMVVTGSAINEDVPSAYVAHSSILINSDIEFSNMVSAEGWQGNGTELNPWVIEGYDINGSALGIGIYIGNVTRHFEIRDCYLHDSGFFGLFYYKHYGLVLLNVQNGSVMANTVSYNFDSGIIIDSSYNTTVTNNMISSSDWGYGIEILSSNDIFIENNTVESCRGGIGLEDSEDSFLSENIVFNNDNGGIAIIGVNNCMIIKQNISYNGGSGISISSSFNISFLDNILYHDYSGVEILPGSKDFIFKNNSFTHCSFQFWHWSLDEWTSYEIDESNTVNGKPIYYWANINGGIVPPGAGQIILANCTNVIVENQNLNDASTGIIIGHSPNNYFRGNEVSRNCYYGIYSVYSDYNSFSENMLFNNEGTSIKLVMCDDNIISNNTINNNSWGIGTDTCENLIIEFNILSYNGGSGFSTKNTRYSTFRSNEVFGNGMGIQITSSSYYNSVYNNLISSNGLGIRLSGGNGYNDVYHNNIIDNDVQAYNDYINQWNLSYPTGGNYWSDYNGTDIYSGPNQDLLDSDGIGDTPYSIVDGDGLGVDNYPLMEPYNLEPSLDNSPQIITEDVTTAPPDVEYYVDYEAIDNDGIEELIVYAEMPQNISRNSVVWTGEYAYSFGGYDGPYSNISRLDKIFRFDPITGETIELPSKLPSPRQATTAVWDGQYAYVFGGWGNGIERFDDIVRFDPVTGEVITLTAKLPTPRATYSSVWDGQYAYIFGGYASGSVHFEDIVRFDPSTEEVTVVATLPHSTSTSVAWDGQYAYIFGGYDGVSVYDTIQRFDPATNEVITLPSVLPETRILSSATWGDEYAYVFGGRWDDTIIRFDPDIGEVIELPTLLPENRASVSAAFWDGNSAYLIGGYTSDWGENETDEIIRFTPGEILAWSLSTNANWLSINSETGELSGTPSSEDVGIYWVNVTVTDSSGGVDWHNFTLVVEENCYPDLYTYPEDITFSNPNPSQWEGIMIEAEIHNGGSGDTSDWPMFGHNPQHTGNCGGDAPDTNETLWIYEAPDTGKIHSPCVVGETVYITWDKPNYIGGPYDSIARAINAIDGNVIWETNVSSDSWVSDPILYEGKLYLRSNGGPSSFFCLNASSGDIIWNITISENSTNAYVLSSWSYPVQSPLVVNGKVYAVIARYVNGSYNHSTLSCLDYMTGEVLWERYMDYCQEKAQIAYSSEKLFLVGGPTVDTRIFCMDAETGDSIWIFNESCGGFNISVTVDGNRIYAGDCFGVMWCIDANTGIAIWNQSIGPYQITTCPAIAYDKVFVGFGDASDLDPGIVVFDKENGEILWTYLTSARPLATPAIADGKVFASFYRYIYPNPHYILAFDQETGAELWNRTINDTPPVTTFPSHTSLAISNGRLFGGIGGPKLYCFGSSSSPLLASNVNATCTVSFYIDEITPENLIYREYEVFVPAGGSSVVSYDWLADVTGNHTIIVDITDSNPLEIDLTNNTASKDIFISEPCGQLKVKASSDKQKYITGVDTEAEIIVKVTNLGELIEGADVQAWVIDPNAVNMSVSMSEISPGIYTGLYSFINSSSPGTYRIKVIASKVGYLNGENNDAKDKFFLDSPVAQMPTVSGVSLSNSILDAGEVVILTATVQEHENVETIYASLNNHGSWGTFVQPLYDDGTHSDSTADDGIFTGIVQTDVMADTYSLDILVNDIIYENHGAIIVSPSDLVTMETFTGLQTIGGIAEIVSPITNTTIELSTVSDISDISFTIVEHRSPSEGKSLEIIPNSNAVTGMISAYIEMSYIDDDIPTGVAEEEMRIYLYNIYTSQLEPLDPNGIDTNGDIIWGDTEHFSDFRMAAIDIPDTYEISLELGWNLISLPLVQDDTSIEAVLASVDGLWDNVKYYDSSDPTDPWKGYATNKPASRNDLSSIDNTMGFWLHMKVETTLTVFGTVPESTQINLNSGWNLVGFPTLDDTMTVANALWGTGADRVEVFDPASPYLISEVDSDYVLQPGEGYWVHVPADTVWTVP